MTSKRPRVLVAAPQAPAPDRESGSRRTLDAVEFFLELGWQVTVAVSSPSPTHTDEDSLRSRGVELVAGFGDPLDKRLLSDGYSLAWIAFWRLAENLIPRLRELSRATKILVDSIDLHFLRRCREAFLDRNPQGDLPFAGFLDPDHGIDLCRELNTYASADTTLTVSDKEAALLRELLGDRAPVRCWPDGEELPRFHNPFASRRGALFLGNFLHPPNRDGLRWLCREVLPELPASLLQKHPLIVVGNGVDTEVESWTRGEPGVELVGWAPSLDPYWKGCRISVVPLRYGAGTKRKLIQSLMSGLPVVSTPMGIEGFDLRDGREVLLAESPHQFAQGMTLLLEDAERWENLARRGRRAILRHHYRKQTRKRFEQIVTGCLQLKVKGPREATPPDWLNLWLRRSYWVMGERLRTVVETCVPTDTIVAVVSRGDGELLRLGARQGWHFPRQADGLAAGFHPADDEWAIGHLLELVQQGVRYLVVPATSYWWLDHYRRFGEFLQCHGSVLFDDPDTCRVYSLSLGDQSGAGEETCDGRKRVGR